MLYEGKCPSIGKLGYVVDPFVKLPPSSGYTLSDYLLKRMILSPNHWNGYVHPQVLSWQEHKFSLEPAPTGLRGKQGVYSFVIRPQIASHPHVSYLMYVGQSKNLFSRYKQYQGDAMAGAASKRPHITEILDRWQKHLWFYYCETSLEAAQLNELEDSLIAAFLPPGNREFPATVSQEIRRLFAA